MSSSKEYVDYIVEQLSSIGDASSRAMMGEYVVYYRDRVIGGVYDDRFLVKPTESAQALMPHAERIIPYKGAKEMILVDCIENRALLEELLEAMYSELPARKPRKRKSPKEGCAD